MMVGMLPLTGSSRRRRMRSAGVMPTAAGMTACVLGLVVGLVVSTTGAPTARAEGMPTSIGSWCTTLFGASAVAGSAAKADALMAGRADTGQGGIYLLSEHPDWKPQKGTDTSGDRHANSLNWALPLLFRGVSTQNQAMVDRFRQLLYYWIDDHQGARGAWVDSSIYGGLRTETLVCAAQTLNDPKIQAAALDDAQRMLKGTSGKVDVRVGVNNTDLIRQTGALAAYCAVGDAAGRDKAWSNLVSMARGVVNDDGSDVEGSPGYAMYIEKLLRDTQAAATTCSLPSADPIPALRNQLIGFVAQSVRPDFTVESLGDTLAAPITGSFGGGDPRADWSRSHGATGTTPAETYATYTGGYVFGRAGWHPQPGGPDSFYSLRFTSSRPATAHTHDDGLGLTFYSRGVEWFGDPGPYRYDNASAMRTFIKSRGAHSSVTLTNVKRTRENGVKLIKGTSDAAVGGNDYTCLDDRTWGSVDVIRCTTYVRSMDAMIIVDTVNATKIKGKAARATAATRTITEAWQLPPGVATNNVNGTLMQLSHADKRLDVIKSGPGDWALQGSQASTASAWFTGSWGQPQPATVLSRTIGIPAAGGVQSMVTVLVPHMDSESVSVKVDDKGVAVTRGGKTITTPLPGA